MKHWILLAIIVILTMGCKRKRDSIERFWSWFTENKSFFEKINDSDRDEKLDTILNHLNTISEGLSVEISDEFKGNRDVVISPDGDETKFKIVREIMDRAPTLKGWTFTAFKQATKQDFTLEHEGIRFKPSEMFFYPKINGSKLDLIIFSENVRHYNADTIAYYGLITMGHVLGEYDYIKKVHHYDFRDINDKQYKSERKPMIELKAFVDNFYKKQKNF